MSCRIKFGLVAVIIRVNIQVDSSEHVQCTHVNTQVDKYTGVGLEYKIKKTQYNY